MDPVKQWTKEYFLSHQDECLQKLKVLSLEERFALKRNLEQCEIGKICLLSNGMITDMFEPEFYCERYEVKSAEGNVLRIELGKFSDKLNINDGETVEDPSKFLSERQTFLVTKSESMNQWVYDVESVMQENGNKRKMNESQNSLKGFAVKVYETADLPMNSIVDVIGFLSSSAKLSPGAMDDENFTEETQDLPGFTIHAVTFKELSHNNPLLIDSTEKSDAEEMQKDLLKVLTQFMFGDELAATYCLCHLISNVYARVSGEVLGKFSLNLTCSSVPKELLSEHIKKFYNFIELLVPNSFYLPLTIENFNTKTFVPKKDYKTNRLQPGILQLPKHSHLVLDETKLDSGKLEAPGCMAVADLSELINSQQLSYDFGFYKLPFHTNIPVLILSEGKSLLPSDFIVPIKVDEDSIKLINENIAAGVHFLKPKLNTIRKYLTECRICEFEIGENETKVIENDFVKMREEFKLQVEDLHSLIVISRLVGISKGLKKLDLPAWEIAKILERERVQRLHKQVVHEG